MVCFGLLPARLYRWVQESLTKSFHTFENNRVVAFWWMWRHAIRFRWLMKPSLCLPWSQAVNINDSKFNFWLMILTWSQQIYLTWNVLNELHDPLDTHGSSCFTPRLLISSPSLDAFRQSRRYTFDCTLDRVEKMMLNTVLKLQMHFKHAKA